MMNLREPTDKAKPTAYPLRTLPFFKKYVSIFFKNMCRFFLKKISKNEGGFLRA
jgi:hypothetical protein